MICLKKKVILKKLTAWGFEYNFILSVMDLFQPFNYCEILAFTIILLAKLI